MGILKRLLSPNIDKLYENKDVDRLINSLEHKDEKIQIQAAKALGDIGLEARIAVPSLVAMLKSKNWRVRKSVVKALGKIAADPKIAIEVLAGVLNDVNKSVCKEAIWALVQFGEPGVKALIDFDISDPDIRLSRAAQLGDLGKYDQAIVGIDEIIKAKGGPEGISPNQIWLFVMRGSLKRDIGRLDSAIKDMNMAISLYAKLRLKPKWDPGAYAIRGDAWGLTKSLKATERYKALKQLKAHAYFERGLCYLRSGKLKKGRLDMKKAVELDYRVRKKVDKTLQDYSYTL